MPVAILGVALLAPLVGVSGAEGASLAPVLGPVRAVDVGLESNVRPTGCLPSEFLVGRRHDGDENGRTWHYCGQIQVEGVQGAFRTTSTKSAWIRESSGTEFTCAEDQLMYQRIHVNDENGSTEYRCAAAEALLDGRPLRLRVIDHQWSAWMNERNSNFRCPADRQFVTGRVHRGDENGQTRYQCAAVTTISPRDTDGEGER